MHFFKVTAKGPSENDSAWEICQKSRVLFFAGKPDLSARAKDFFQLPFIFLCPSVPVKSIVKQKNR